MDPKKPYIKLAPNKKIHVDILPITKYFTPASEELISFLENDTSMYKARLCNSIDKNKDKISFADTINIIPITDKTIKIGNSILFRFWSLLIVIYIKIIMLLPINNKHFMKEPNESITKKPFKISLN